MQHQQLPRNAHSQRGVAILTVLIIVALVMTLATVILARQSRTVRQTDNYQSLERAWQYAFALEQYVGMELQRDLKTNKYDALTESWATVVPTLPLEEGNGVKIGEFKGRVEDLQARFNINNVLDENGKLRTSGEDQQLKRLVQWVGLPDGFATSIIDWIDPDTVIQSGESAEGDYYLSSAIPYRAADMPLADTSELRLIRLEGEAKDKETALKKLLPYVTALPLKKTTVNANTASKPVLTALGLNTQQIETIITAQREKKPFKSSNELFNALNLDEKQSEVLKTALDVNSQYFRLQGEIKVGRARVYLSSVFFRAPDKPIRVIMRQFDRVNDTQPATTTDDADTTPATS